ncbi:Erf-like ssDNA annealing protein [Dunaliella viridis virus SI2]|uniref:Erf-like ssDNA annealing protein n=1 Tax=Dunaliella viridis virus SI2 TaxID=754069 RepID=UPI0002C04AE5|nr:Erf-like ssDNA annealing protein [Dunaliella viridis virus SI2]AGH16007.1 ERF family protein [Dunaliella viridis virus SI2]
MSEQTQLATTESAKQITLGDVLASITDLAKDPDVDPGKMQALVDLQTGLIDRQAMTSFRAAMHRARQNMPRISKDGVITNKQGKVQSRYAHYEAIDKIVRPIVEAEGLTYGFDFREGDGGRLLVTCIVSHVDGHEERFGPMPLAIDTTGAKNATQGAGSAGQYGKRYTLCAAFNIITEGKDDDGNMGRAPAGDPAAGFQDLLDSAQKAAAQGLEAYGAFFKSRTNLERGWLMDEGHHENLKRGAEAHDG